MDLTEAQTIVNSANQDHLRGLAHDGAPSDDPLIKWRQHFADDRIESIEFKTLGTEGEQLLKTIAKAFPGSSQNTWTYNELQEVVRQSRNEWESKERVGNGKPQKLFHNCLSKLDAHSSLFRFIPSGDKYFTIVTGAITTLVKASSSHTKTIEALSSAIGTINDAAEHCSTESKLIQSHAMRDAIAKFYIAVFLFFGDAIVWYKSSSKKKIMNSLHNEFSEKFRLSLKIIESLSMNVRRVAELGTGAEVRVIRLELQELQSELQDIRVGLTGQLRMLAELSHQQHNENIEHHRRTQVLLAEYVRKQHVCSGPNAIEVSTTPLSLHAIVEDAQGLPIGIDSEPSREETASFKMVDYQLNNLEEPNGDCIDALEDVTAHELKKFVLENILTIEDVIEKSFGPLTALQHNSHPIDLALAVNHWICYGRSTMLYIFSPDQGARVASTKVSWQLKRSLEAARKPIVLCHPTALLEHGPDHLVKQLMVDLVFQIINTLPEGCYHDLACLQSYVLAYLHGSTVAQNEMIWETGMTLLGEALQIVPDNTHILLHWSGNIATKERSRLTELVSLFQKVIQSNSAKVLKVIVFSEKLIALTPPLRQDQIRLFSTFGSAEMRIHDTIPT